MRTAITTVDSTGSLVAAPVSRSDRFEFSPSIQMLSASRSVTAESIRALRTHIQSQHLQEGRRGLAVCGPSVDVGCTFTAVNLAVALSMIGVDTLLVDANMREPGIDQVIRPAKIWGGLRDALADPSVDVGDFIEDDVLPNLSVLYSGGEAPDAQELLARDRFGDVINSCLRDYDATIVDTPPANTCADVRRISNVVRYSLVVTRKHRSLMADVKTLVNQLEDDRATVIGTILNEY